MDAPKGDTWIKTVWAKMTLMFSNAVLGTYNTNSQN